MRPNANVAVVLAFACVSCGTGEHLADCPNMPVKGWDALPEAKEFASLSHRKERIYEPLSESSQVLWADSNIAYGALLTFDLAHPRFTSGAPDEKCIREASFMALVPLEPSREAKVAAFTEFLRTRGVPAAIVERIDAARENKLLFGPVGEHARAVISAGIVTQGARGRFFRIQVTAPR
jgi:hypothetical protein